MPLRTTLAASIVCTLAWLGSTGSAQAAAPDLRWRSFYLFVADDWIVVTIREEDLATGVFTGSYFEYHPSNGLYRSLPISGRIEALRFAYLPGVPHTFGFSFSTPLFSPPVRFNGRLVKLQTSSPYDAYIYGDLDDSIKIIYVTGWDWLIE
jgi:hypothetical protein